MAILVQRASHSSILERNSQKTVYCANKTRKLNHQPFFQGLAMEAVMCTAPYLCEVRTTALPSLVTLRMQFHRNLFAFGSIPVVGSSFKREQEKEAQWNTLTHKHKTLFRDTSGTMWMWGIVPHQEYDRWSPDESDGSGEFPLVASTVSSSLTLSVMGQSELLHTPLRHLRDNRQSYRWAVSSIVKASFKKSRMYNLL